ncbi:MAG: hypothetical protein ACXAC7_11575 [Candidatus Hodarchaeales archaeon]
MIKRKMSILVFIMIVWSFFTPLNVVADVGPVTAGNYETCENWLNPQNTVIDDTAYARTSTTGSTCTWGNFGLNDLSGSISGITVTAIIRGTVHGEITKVELLYDNTSTAAYAICTNHFDCTQMTDEMSDVVYTFGSSSDLWGNTWTASDFVDGNFGVRITAVDAGFWIDVDYLTVTVTGPTVPEFSLGVGIILFGFLIFVTIISLRKRNQNRVSRLKP